MELSAGISLLVRFLPQGLWLTAPSPASIGYGAFARNDHLSSIALPAPAQLGKAWKDSEGNYYEPGSTITKFYRAYTLTDRRRR